MKNKFKSKAAFTLAELLIVIAIIVVLVGISIPVFVTTTSKANRATDQANIRGATSEAIYEILSDDTYTGTATIEGVATKIEGKVLTLTFTCGTLSETKTVDLKFYTAVAAIVWNAEKNIFDMSTSADGTP